MPPPQQLSNEEIENSSSEVKILKRRVVDFSSGEEDFIPSHQRLTQNGGYTHTKSSRLKISQANSGNVPWNKGKNRTSDAKAKISAGVRARNHAILLKKLEKLGMSEAEWEASRRKLKVIRERVRKLRATVSKEPEALAIRRQARHEEELNDRMKRKYFDFMSDDETSQKESTSESEEPLSEPEVPSDFEFPTDQLKKEDMNDDDDSKNDQTNNDKVNDTDDGIQNCKSMNEKDDNFFSDEDESAQRVPSIFVRDVCWTPHPLDSKDVSYANLCPYGGPGGLICCEICAANYSKFLSKSYRNLEQQKIAKVGTELRELLKFKKQAKEILSETVREVRTKPVPYRSHEYGKETNFDNDHGSF